MSLSDIWSARIVSFIGMIFLYILFMIEIVTRNRIGILNDSSISLKPRKWLNIWSLLTIIFCCVRQTSWAFTYIPQICMYINPVYFPPDGACAIFLTFYQISRLRYCFQSDYSKSTFMALYVFGLILLVLRYIHSITGLKSVLIDGEYCARDLKISRIKYGILKELINLLYYLWDISLLVIYVAKIHKLKKETQISHQLQNANAVLHKVVILTLIFEIISLLRIIVIITIYNYLHTKPSETLAVFTGTITTVTVAVIMSLMMEHHNNIYTKLSCCCLCCCCQSFVDKSIYNYQQVPYDSDKKDQTSTHLPHLNINLQLPQVTSYISNITDDTYTTNYIKEQNADSNRILPLFNIHNRFIENAKIIYAQLLSMGYNDLISLCISEFAATRYMNCIMCEQCSFGCIECCYDYSIKYATLVNYDKNNKMRFFLNSEEGFSNIDNNQSTFDIDKEIICTECAMNWKCSICESLYLISDYENTYIIEEGCHECGCIICDNCALYYRDRVYCQNCCDKRRKIYVDDESMVQSYKSYKSSEKSTQNSRKSKWDINRFKYFDISSKTKS